MNQEVLRLVEGKFEHLYQRMQNLETSQHLPEQLITELESLYTDMQHASQELGGELQTLLNKLGMMESPSDTPQIAEESTILQKVQQLQDLFEHAPVGLALLDAQPPYEVLTHNHAYQNYLHKTYPEQGLVGMFASELFPRTKQDKIFELFEEVSRTGQPKTLSAFEIQDAHDGVSWWNLYLAPVYADGHLAAFSHMLVDVTGQVQSRRLLERQLAERELAENELAKANLILAQSKARFHVALKHSPIMVYNTDRELRYTWVHNPRHGYEPDQILGKRDDELLPPQDVRELVEFKKQILETGQGQRREIRFKNGDRYFTYDVTAEPLLDTSGQITGLTVAAYDVTGIKELHAEMLARSAEIETHHLLSEQRERERMEIARYLHDGPVQDLLAATYELQAAMLDASNDSVVSKLNEVSEDVKRVIQKLRNYSYELKPPMLSNFSLAKNLRSYTERFREQYPHIQVRLDLQEDKDLLPSRVRTALFRVFQETLNNVARHAQAQEVLVRLSLDAEMVYVEVVDNGVGFEVPEQWLSIARQGHLGLVGIWERVEGLGGEFKIHSSVGEGTRVKISVPYSLSTEQDKGEVKTNEPNLNW